MSEDVNIYINHRRDEIEEYLETLRDMVLKGEYEVSLNKNRQENINFIEKYNLNEKKRKEILLSITSGDFLHSADNITSKEEYKNERVYIFCKEKALDNFGALEIINIYIKTNITKTRSGDKYMFVISFHESNKPVKYLFR